MSLNWDTSNIENWEETCSIWRELAPSEGKPRDDEETRKEDDKVLVKRLNPVTYALIWGTISVGIGEITQKNAAEFFARYDLIQRIDVGHVVKDDKTYYLTPTDIRAHVGLRTNVGPNETRPSWYKRVVKQRLDDLIRIYNRTADEDKG